MESTIRPILEKFTNMTREERRKVLDAWIKAHNPNATIEADKVTKGSNPFQEYFNAMVVDNIVDQELVGKALNARDNIVLEAFREHFGFELPDVQDTDELECLTDPHSTIESFRYRGETFLYWDRDPKIEFNFDGKNNAVTFTTQFKKV